MLYKLIIKLFPKTIAKTKAINTLNMIDFVSGEMRKDIERLGWKCDEDIDGGTYADLVEKKLEILRRIAIKNL